MTRLTLFIVFLFGMPLLGETQTAAPAQDVTALEAQYKVCAKHYIPAEKCTSEIYQQLKDKENVPPDSPTAAALISEVYVFRLSVLATVGLAIMWLAFWIAVSFRHKQESVHEILQSAGFFRTVTVMGVIAATVVLSLAGKVDGNITGAILSGIVGYVLGQLAGRGHGHSGKQKSENEAT
jgi:hypothetical protein